MSDQIICHECGECVDKVDLTKSQIKHRECPECSHDKLVAFKEEYGYQTYDDWFDAL